VKGDFPNMAKKIRNLLLLGAAVGAAAAGTYYYLQKKDADYFDEDDDEEDFDLFEDEDDLDSRDSKSSRNYVPLHFDGAADSSKEETSEADTPSEEASPKQNVTLESMDSVEEFYDDDEDEEEIDDTTPVDNE